MISMTWPQYLRGECAVDLRSVSLAKTRRGSVLTGLLATLLIRYPNTTTEADLIESTYPDDEPDYAADIVRTGMKRLMARIGQYHFTVRDPVGWRVVQWPLPKALAA